MQATIQENVESLFAAFSKMSEQDKMVAQNRYITIITLLTTMSYVNLKGNDRYIFAEELTKFILTLPENVYGKDLLNSLISFIQISFGRPRERKLPKRVCVAVKYLRSSLPRYDNIREWQENSKNLYVGRRGRIFINGVIYHYKQSPWANPYKVHKDDSNLNEALVKYSKDLDILLTNDKMREEFMRLYDYDEIGCYCEPHKRCHCDVIIAKLTELS
jgi:hypothetical protein